MCKGNLNIIRNEKGIVLLIALMVLIMLSLMGLAAILTGTTDIQIAGNETHSTQALYLAEAGVGQVKSWFEDWASYGNNPPPASSLATGYVMGGTYVYPRDFFRKRRIDSKKAPNYINNGNLSQFTDINDNNIIDAADANNVNDDNKANTDQNTAYNNGDRPVLSITDATYLNSLFQNLSGMGRVTVLEIYPPMQAPANTTNYATVRVTAVDAAGATRTIEQEIGPSFNIAVTSGLSAGAVANWNGNGNVHWGPIVVSGSVDMGQNSVHCKDHNVCGGTNDIDSGAGQADKWWSLDATQDVTIQHNPFPSGSYTTANYNITPNDPSATPPSLSDDTKAQLKQYSQDTQQYYVVCSDGKLYHGDRYGNPTGAGTDFKTLTNGKTFSMLYVDIGVSCNPANPPPPQFSVNGNYWTKSNMILDGSISFGGLGSGLSTTIQNPDEVDNGQPGTKPPLDVNINGLIYTTGNFDSGGNPVVYGAVIAGGGFTGSGTPDIWYNRNLAYGLTTLPQTSVQGWREIRPQ